MRNKSYTFINIVGLGIGMATIVWAFQNYRFSFSFDQIHQDKDRIFRVDTFREGQEILNGICPMPIALSAKEDFSSIEEVVRYERTSLSVKASDKQPLYQDVYFTDPSFFEVFDFKIISGAGNITDKKSVIISEEVCGKYFGDKENNYANILGKTISIYSGEEYQKDLIINGIIENAPINSSIRYNIISHIDNLHHNNGKLVQQNDWKYFLHGVFFKLKNKEDAPEIAEDLKKYIGPQNTAREDWKVSGFYLEPLTEVSNHDGDIGSNIMYERPPDSATFGPAFLAFLIFMICCLNFANTTVARSNRRLKEMGVRKVMGGTQQQLMFQMLLECGLIVLAGLFIAYELNEYWFPAYNQMWAYWELNLNYLADTHLLLFIAAAVLLTTLIAGSYPAFYISRFNPNHIFRGGVKFGGSNLFSRILLGLQISISLITVIASIGFSKNSEFQKNYDFGYDRQNILFAQIRNNDSFEGFKNAVDQMPDVISTAGTNNHIGHNWRWQTYESQGAKKEGGYMSIGHNYLNTMDIELLNGRAFDKNKVSDFENALLVNEKMVTLFGWPMDEVIGRKINIDTQQYNIIGLLKDFHINNLFSEINPVAMTLAAPDNYYNLIVKATPGKTKNIMDQMSAKWAQQNPYQPYEGYYQVESTDRAQSVTDNIAYICSIFAIISVLLTAIGIFALVSQTVLQKMKEIAIRKVVGASSSHIIYLVNKGYIWIFLMAAIIGSYVGMYVTQLLMDSIFRINVGVKINTLVISFGVLLMIVFFTVSIKVWSALRVNPAEILKNE